MSNQMSSDEVATPRVTIEPAALEFIHTQIESDGVDLETGGILLGHTRPGHLHITVAGGPGPGARRTPNAFSRDRTFTEELADRVWEADRSHWIGEWHTHPGSAPVPSPVDLASYLEHLSDPDLLFDVFVCVIAAVKSPEPTAVACWVVASTHAVNVPLEPTEERTQSDAG
jgi:integrative and conjugative element protein (TIGR02256 family)